MEPHDVVVVVPTYNEAPNVEALANQVSAHGYRLLIVDDSSPDGTGDIADRIAAANPLVSVLHRTEKEGLGPAYSAGYEEAVAMDARITCGMDADFSHDPADLPRLVDAVVSGADLSIGSRYVEGGAVVNWSMFRRVISRGGNRYARVLLGLDPRDATAGFRAYRTKSLMALEPRTCEATGYGFLVELAYRATKARYTIVELPVIFTDRDLGDSKMSLSIAFETFALVTRWGIQRFIGRMWSWVRRA